MLKALRCWGSMMTNIPTVVAFKAQRRIIFRSSTRRTSRGCLVRYWSRSFWPSNAVFLFIFSVRLLKVLLKKNLESVFLLNAWSLFFEPDFLSSQKHREAQPAYHLTPRGSVAKHFKHSVPVLGVFFDSCNRIRYQIMSLSQKKLWAPFSFVIFSGICKTYFIGPFETGCKWRKRHPSPT